MNKWELSCAEIDTVQTINPETAAHNIAQSYIQSLPNSKISVECDVDSDVIFAMSEKYLDAYNYAYNYFSKQNDIINSAE